MNAHTVDLARFLVGEIESVCAAEEIFVKERPLQNENGTGKVTADDALCFLAKFQDGALGNFIAKIIYDQKFLEVKEVSYLIQKD